VHGAAHAVTRWNVCSIAVSQVASANGVVQPLCRVQVCTSVPFSVSDVAPVSEVSISCVSQPIGIVAVRAKSVESGSVRRSRLEVPDRLASAHIELTVSDTGVGIAPEFLPHVFERFRQADASSTRERGGLGLGLSIARQLTEMHGATIEASSEGLGRGATFCVKVPTMIVHPVRDDVARVHPRSVSVSAHAAVAMLTGIHVLALDDEPDALALVGEILESRGARVTTAGSAEDALRKLVADVPDVILADLGMPRVDGFGFIDRLRHHDNPRVRELPAAALTAYARSEDRMKALQAGFQIHVVKPIDPAELVTTIASLAKRVVVRNPAAPSESSST